ELYGEVILPEAAPAAGLFRLHPALLDAALHVLALGSQQVGTVALPFCWTGVSLHASGAERLRVRLRRGGGGGAGWRGGGGGAGGTGGVVGGCGSRRCAPAGPRPGSSSAVGAGRRCTASRGGGWTSRSRGRSRGAGRCWGMPTRG